MNGTLNKSWSSCDWKVHLFRVSCGHVLIQQYMILPTQEVSVGPIGHCILVSLPTQWCISLSPLTDFLSVSLLSSHDVCLSLCSRSLQSFFCNASRMTCNKTIVSQAMWMTMGAGSRMGQMLPRQTTPCSDGVFGLKSLNFWTNMPMLFTLWITSYYISVAPNVSK